MKSVYIYRLASARIKEVMALTLPAEYKRAKLEQIDLAIEHLKAGRITEDEAIYLIG